MNLIYDSSFSLAAMPTPQTLLATESIEYTHTAAVTGWALFDVVGTVKIQASDDNFSSTTYDSGNIVSTGVDLLAISTIAAAKWRILAVTGVTAGLLYLGTHATVIDPVVPFGLEDNVIADDRRDQGGALHSVVTYTAKRGNLSFRSIQTAEAATWRAAYLATNGWRRGFVIDPSSSQILGNAPSNNFAMTENAAGRFQLQMPGFHEII